MKRKVGSSGRLRLSPNEEAFVLKEDYERRRKLRLLQVREQERGIAFQIREDIKRRRNQQFVRLAEELRAEWAESQTQKIKKLEKLYLASLRTLGEGHQQATVHEPDLNALEQQAAERKLKAEIRHKEALKVQKDQKEQLMKQKTWHLQARKDALLVEKERSARVTRLPPPPPPLFENIDLSRIPPVRTSCDSYHHLSSLVNREMDTGQPDAHLAAEEEAKRLEDVEQQASRERAERCEKAHIRGSRALTRIRLAQNQEKLLRELKQLQQEDLARRRQTVAQMPAQLVELPYRRSEMKEEWQRELEFAFEDMYNADRKVEGNLVLHLEPEPLPVVADQIRDEDLDLSMEQELLGDATSPAVVDVAVPSTSDADVKPQPVPSKLLFKKLLSKIRNQKSLWTVQSVSEEEGSLPTYAEGSSSQEPSAETEVSAATESETTVTTVTDMATDSGPLPKSLPAREAEPGEEAGMPEVQPVPSVAAESIESMLLHPQEVATKVRMAARRRQIMELEEQKQKQLELLEQIEQQKLRLESDRFRAQLEEKRMAAQRAKDSSTSTPSSQVAEDSHRQTIRSYQRHLLQQNRLHRQTVQAARKQLLEFQSVLRGTHLGPGTAGLAPGLRPGLHPGGSMQGLLLGGAVSTDTPSTSALLAQTPQAVVHPHGPDSSPGPHQAPSHHTLPASRSASGEASAQPRGAPSLLTCSSRPAASGVILPSLDKGATRRDLLQLLREQLDVQREALQSQEAQKRLQPGACFPLPPLGFSAPQFPASKGPGQRPESSPLGGDPGMFSGHLRDPQPVWVSGPATPGAGKQEADPQPQHPLTLPPTADTLSAELPEPSLCPPLGPARPLSVVHQFLPLHNCLKLLQAQLATQWEALAARHDAQAQLLARRLWDPGHSSAGHGSSAQLPGPCSPTQERPLPPSPRHEELCPVPCRHTHRLQGGLGDEPETRDWAQGPGRAVGGLPRPASPSHTLFQVTVPEGARTPPFHEKLKKGSQPVPPAPDSVQGDRETLDSGDVPVQGQKSLENLPSEPAGPQEPPAESDPGHVQALELQARLQRLSRLLQPQCGQLQALQERLVAQRAALTCTGEAPVPSAHPLPPDHSGLAALQQELDSQKKSLRAQQAAQERLLLQRLQELERRVCAPWAAGAEGGPKTAGSLLNGPQLTASQGPRPHDLLSSRPTEPCPLASAEGGPTDPSDTGQLWGQLREGQREMQGQQHVQRPQAAPQEALDTGSTCVPPEGPGVLDVAAEGQPLAELLPCPSLLAPATVPVTSLPPEPLHRAGPRPPRPPVARIQSGLELQQHELSLIPESESPAPSDFCQDRDPLRVSISREQSPLGDALAQPASTRPPLVHAAAAGAVKGQEEPEHRGAVLSCTVEAVQTHHSPALEPAQETYHEPLSITISTGSFLSFENPDLSLTDSDSFSENVGPGLQAEAEVCLGLAPLAAHPGPDPLDMAALVLQRADAHQEDSSSTAQTPTPPEPEATFPDVHHQQFKPLEAHLDLDVSPLSCGLNLSQASEHSRESCSSVPLPTSSSSSTSLTVCPHPLLTTGSAWPPAPTPAYTTAPCLADRAESSQQPFLRLLPELSSPENQQADLPSILSIEAGDRPGCLDHQDPSEQLEQSPKNVHFQFPVELAVPSPSEACALHRLLLLPSQALPERQLSGAASELSVELHRGAREVSPLAVPLPPSTQAGTPTRQAGPELSVSSGSFSSRSLIPVWETESGRGIMEEPDLTLVSLSDVSIETDFFALSLEEKENEVQSSFQASPCPHATGHCGTEASGHSPQLTGSLQGAHVARNQPFTTRCSQRQKQLQNKTRASENSQSKLFREKPGGSGSRLKGVSRVSTSTEDRRPFTHQRALRLYNHTAEVKHQMEEKTRQDAYAQNRARAKEFHKKTLEKLRAKNTY